MFCDALVCPTSFPWRFIHIFATPSHMDSVCFANHSLNPVPNAITEAAKTQLSQYFAQGLRIFTLPIPAQGTTFQTAVYDQLIQIAYGETRSYKQIAMALGAPTKSRAVGRACGLNKLAIIVPCHRVISSSGELTGYADGLETKAWLLNHERQHQT